MGRTPRPRNYVIFMFDGWPVLQPCRIHLWPFRRAFALICDHNNPRMQVLEYQGGGYIPTVLAPYNRLAKWNDSPKPLVWTTTADVILEKARRCKESVGTAH